MERCQTCTRIKPLSHYDVKINGLKNITCVDCLHISNNFKKIKKHEYKYCFEDNPSLTLSFN